MSLVGSPLSFSLYLHMCRRIAIAPPEISGFMCLSCIEEERRPWQGPNAPRCIVDGTTADRTNADHLFRAPCRRPLPLCEGGYLGRFFSNPSQAHARRTRP